MAVENFLKKTDIEFDCSQKIYHWKSDNFPLEGTYKLKSRGGRFWLSDYKTGIRKMDQAFFKDKKTDKTIYYGNGESLTTVYNEHSLVFSVSFDATYDSASFYYNNYYLQYNVVSLRKKYNNSSLK